MLKLRSSARIKKRYIYAQGSKEDIEKAILDYIGVLGWAKAKVVFVNTDKGESIISVDRKELVNVRAAFEMSKDVKIKKISGTIKGLG